MRCSSSRCPPGRRWWTPKGANNGRIRSEVRRSTGRNAPSGGRSRLGERTARPFFPAELPDLLHQAAPRDCGPGDRRRQEEDQPGEVPDLQSAVRHADSGRAADFEGSRSSFERLTDAKLAPHIKAVREEVKNGSQLSDAFARQDVFPPIYITSVLAGEKSGSLGEVLDRFITYQKLALAVRKK